jgi:hypothetical protein
LTNKISNAVEIIMGYDCGGAGSIMQLGLWYVYHARISGPVHVMLCGPGGRRGNSFLDVYHASEINDLGCPVESYDNGGDILDCGGSSVSWDATSGATYYALVGRNSTADVTDEDEFQIQIVDHDECEDAAGPIIPTSLGAVLSYNTMNSDFDTFPSLCGGATSTGPGVWYQVKGTGSALTASTCSDETTFDTQLSVFQGGCGDLVCVNGNNDFCGLQSTVVWPSVQNETYLVLVSGFNGTTGDFTLKVSTDTPRKENDFCASASAVTEAEEVTFTFSGSSADPDLPQCDEESIAVGGMIEFPYGIWYSIVGTGLSISATLSASLTTSPVFLNIYTGNSCGDLSCLNVTWSGFCQGGDDSMRCYDSACFATTQGEVFHVFVSTFALENVELEHTLAIGSC